MHLYKSDENLKAKLVKSAQLIHVEPVLTSPPCLKMNGSDSSSKSHSSLLLDEKQDKMSRFDVSQGCLMRTYLEFDWPILNSPPWKKKWRSMTRGMRLSER